MKWYRSEQSTVRNKIPVSRIIISGRLPSIDLNWHFINNFFGVKMSINNYWIVKYFFNSAEGEGIVEHMLFKYIFYRWHRDLLSCSSCQWRAFQNPSKLSDYTFCPMDRIYIIQYTLYIIHTRTYTFFICTHAYICSLTRVLAYGSYTVLYKVKAVSIRTVKNLKGFSEFLIRKFTATLLLLLKNWR